MLLLLVSAIPESLVLTQQASIRADADADEILKQ